MAHADYNCCAVCDSKMEYSNDPDTKGRICEYCLKRLRSLGLSILTVEELIHWVESTQVDIVRENLLQLNFQFCHYPNLLDGIVQSRGIKAEVKSRFIETSP